MTKPRGLGRGLGALLSSTPVEEESLVEIPVDRISVNPNQPRKTFDFNSLKELSESIRTSGVIQPIIVRREGDGYQLIAGERRWRAARQAGLQRVPGIVREATDAQSLELALIENLLREDLNPIEEADAYRKLLAQFGWTQDELAQRVGRDRSTIANCLRLLRLPEVIQADLRAGHLTMGHAIALLALPTESEQLRLREQILAHDWSVRATEDSVRVQRALRVGAPRRRTAEIVALEDRLARALMTRVRLRGNGRRGMIEVTYATADELERLTDLLEGRR
ncbi:MAG: ParB/RepB/Spo0J family partition protein [Candidatus Rokuibacteriota bacterium]